MAIDIFAIDDRSQQNALFQLGTADLTAMKDALSELRAKTGIVIDPYGTARLYRDQVRLLAQLLRTMHPQDKRVKAFADFLANCTLEALLLVGD